MTDGPGRANIPSLTSLTDKLAGQPYRFIDLIRHDNYYKYGKLYFYLSIYELTYISHRP